MTTLKGVILAALNGDEDTALSGLLELMAPAQEQDRLMDLKTAAAYLGLSEDALDRRARAGIVPSKQEQPRAKRFFAKSELDNYMRGESAPTLRTAA
jgi:hypothetical protein